MSIQGEMKGWQKAVWMLIIAVFIKVEFRAISDDRSKSDAKQSNFFAAQQSGFSATASGLTTAIDGLRALLKTTTKVAENLTGGDSYAYIVPQGNSAVIPLSIHNYGGNILSGVSVQVANIQDHDWGTPPISAVPIGTLAPFGFAPSPR